MIDRFLDFFVRAEFDLGHFRVREFRIERRLRVPRKLQRHWLGFLARDHEIFHAVHGLHASAGGDDRLAGEFLTNVQKRREIVLGVREFRLIFEFFGEFGREFFEPEPREKGTARARRIAVGIVAGPHRNDDGLVQIAVSVEEAQDDARAVDLHVDRAV